MVRCPAEWRITEQGPDDQHRDMANYVKIHAPGLGQICCVEGRAGEYVDETEVLAHTPFIYPGDKRFSVKRFMASYPTDRDVARAMAALPPGDMAKGGKPLPPEEQNACVLAYLSKDLFGGIPTRIDSDSFEAYLGGWTDDQGWAWCTAWVFGKHTPQHGFLHFGPSDSAEVGDLPSVKVLLSFADQFIRCLRPATNEGSGSARSRATEMRDTEE